MELDAGNIVRGYEVLSVAWVALTLAVGFAKSSTASIIRQFFRENKPILPSLALLALLVYILYANKILFAPGFIASAIFCYKAAVVSVTVLAVSLYFRAHPVETVQRFLLANRKVITIVLVLAGVATLVTATSISFNYYVMDVAVFAAPFARIFISGTVLVFTAMVFIRKLEENVVAINYSEIAIYFLILAFFCWVSASAVVSIDFVHDFVVAKFNNARRLPLRYMTVFYAIFGFVIVTFCLFIYVMASRIVRTISTIVVKYLRGQYQYHVINFVYGDEGSGDALSSLQFLKRHAGRSHFRRRIMLREIMFLHKSLSGEITGKSRRLYYELDLQAESLHSLEKGTWPQKIRAVVELSYMDNQEALPGIIHQLQSKNEMLRIEGQVALVKYNSTADTLLFLKNYQNYLTVYEQVHILHVLGKNRMRDVNLVPLLESGNETVVSFALKLAGVFEQTGNYERILPFLTHPSPLVCEAAIQATGKLGLPQGAVPLMQAFEHQTYPNKLRLLDAIRLIPAGECRPWLKGIIDSTADHALRLSACKALQATGYPGENIFETLFPRPGEKLRDLINHVNDKRI